MNAVYKTIINWLFSIYVSTFLKLSRCHIFYYSAILLFDSCHPLSSGTFLSQLASSNQPRTMASNDLDFRGKRNSPRFFCIFSLKEELVSFCRRVGRRPQPIISKEIGSRDCTEAQWGRGSGLESRPTWHKYWLEGTRPLVEAQRVGELTRFHTCRHPLSFFSRFFSFPFFPLFFSLPAKWDHLVGHVGLTLRLKYNPP